MGYFSNKDIDEETDKEVYGIDKRKALEERRQIYEYMKERETQNKEKKGEQILEEREEEEELER